MNEYSFMRYLEAKKSVDDRALNRLVWRSMVEELRKRKVDERLRVLEIGAGIGTMFERLVEWGALDSGQYTAIDLDSGHIQRARMRLTEWGQTHDWQILAEEWGLVFARKGERLELELQAVDLYDFLKDERRQKGKWDLLVAHALLDLIDVSEVLPGLFALLEPGGLYYFTLNFDGLTIFEPVIEASLDEKVIALYHRSMDERRVDSRTTTGSLTGRRLFTHLNHHGGEILAAGASDWVVYPQYGRYADDEAYFLNYILQTLAEELNGHPELDEGEFGSWIQERRQQVARGELTYIAHQIDFVGRVRDAA